MLYGAGGFGKWNDARSDAAYYTDGYVIEYVPEPSSLAQFGLFAVAVAIGAARGRRR